MIRLLICDDHALFREGLCSILRDHGGIEVVGGAGNGREAVEKAARLHPDVVLMDIELPELSGIEATRRITRVPHGPRVLVLTLYDDEEVVARCLEAGAAGYILKDGPAAELVLAIEAVGRGQRYLSPVALSKLADYPGKGKKARTRYDLLTGREREVLKLLADGCSAKEIAARLALSVKTVDAHKTNLMRKVGVHDRAGLVKYAIRRKLVRIPILDDD